MQLNIIMYSFISLLSSREISLHAPKPIAYAITHREFTIVTSLSTHGIKIMGLAAGAGSDQQMQFPLDQDKRPRYIAY